MRLCWAAAILPERLTGFVKVYEGAFLHPFDVSCCWNVLLCG